jgi:hypothetical protein
MIGLDENALICDLAETYQIYDYRQLPPLLVAVFSCGLRADSRIKMMMSNQVVPLGTLLMASLNDKLAILLWSKTKDGQNGRKRPTSILETLTSKQVSRKEISFNSGEEFEQMRKKLVERAKGGEG